jgi:hypothetical protein
LELSRALEREKHHTMTHQQGVSTEQFQAPNQQFLALQQMLLSQQCPLGATGPTTVAHPSSSDDKVRAPVSFTAEAQVRLLPWIQFQHPKLQHHSNLERELAHR